METITNCIVLEVRNLKETLYFYEGILGLKPSGQRPQLNVPGVWYDVDTTRICFVVNRNRSDGVKVDSPPCIEVAFSISDMEKVKKKLEFYQVSFRKEYGAEGEAIIVYDPDQHKLQIESKVNIQ
ncbi:VOC family protein [Bacillus gaemokensis]|uniref:Lactoylglutathione lyase n=1 Tax=Bacillus gaemokensis TaxID=574375 RepID=A0A073KAD9_9BACI|nr:VOC family protein [Bacillus gaemokensis]KEK24264.1 lactoylglutathione lyase [Bacillus gaemokensis]KYG38220.1 lactoylglutathione lyase [Bacillus gaemokensis]